MHILLYTLYCVYCTVHCTQGVSCRCFLSRKRSCRKFILMFCHCERRSFECSLWSLLGRLTVYTYLAELLGWFASLDLYLPLGRIISSAIVGISKSFISSLLRAYRGALLIFVRIMDHSVSNLVIWTFAAINNLFSIFSLGYEGIARACCYYTTVLWYVFTSITDNIFSSWHTRS